MGIQFIYRLSISVVNREHGDYINNSKYLHFSYDHKLDRGNSDLMFNICPERSDRRQTASFFQFTPGINMHLNMHL